MTASGLPPGLLMGEAGTYHLESPPEDLVRRLAAAGWRTGMFEGAGDRSGVLRGIGRALGFPGYYGANLDALWDCLTDLTEPTALIWQNWQRLAIDRPTDWSRVRAVLDERVATAPRFAVVLAS